MSAKHPPAVRAAIAHAEREFGASCRPQRGPRRGAAAMATRAATLAIRTACDWMRRIEVARALGLRSSYDTLRYEREARALVKAGGPTARALERVVAAAKAAGEAG